MESSKNAPDEQKNGNPVVEKEKTPPPVSKTEDDDELFCEVCNVRFVKPQVGNSSLISLFWPKCSYSKNGGFQWNLYCISANANPLEGHRSLSESARGS